MLESALNEEGGQTQADKQQQKKNSENKMPPTSHTLMDIVITMSMYLPRESFASLFNMASLLINRDRDPQLQKKAYKLIPRLAQSESGRQALQERNIELQQLLSQSAEKASAPARRDRLLAIAQVVEFIPPSDLSFIPSVLSEVVISAKEVNEKARTAAFELLVSMGNKMREGGTVVQSEVKHMPSDAPSVPATLDEYFTMVSAGLAGTTPHMISATITAITRILFDFHDSVPEATVSDLVQTLDLFLENSNREIVRSVLGFVKVCVTSLPTALMLPRLPSLIPHLMVWSHEHKAHFKAKVKHIIERMIRRFGIETIEKHCPAEDKKLIANIRKTRDRRRRKKDAATAAGDEDDASKPKRKGKFESEFDEAVYGSDEASSDSGSDVSDDDIHFKSRDRNEKRGQAFIVEDEDEPLDLLDKRALGHISSTKPLKTRQPPTQKTKAKTDLDGKLILGDDSDNDEAMQIFGDEGEKDPGDGSLEGGINAYVSALKGKDAAKRGQRGKLKFSNKKGQEEDEMDVDEEEVRNIKAKGKVPPKQKQKGVKTTQREKGKAGKGALGGQRRALGAQKVRSGRVEKGGGKGRT